MFILIFNTEVRSYSTQLLPSDKLILCLLEDLYTAIEVNNKHDNINNTAVSHCTYF